MGKYWDWYEVEFDRVGKKLGRERRAEILDSLREHVADASAELRAAQMSDEEAERVAVKNLGAPLDLIRSERDTPRWQWLPVWAAGIGSAWCAFWLLLGELPWSMRMIHPVLWLTPMAVFCATLLGRRIKLWALGGVVFVLGLATLAVLSYTWLDLKAAGGMGYAPRWQVAALNKEVNNRLSTERAKVNYFEQAQHAFESNDRALAKDLVYQVGMGWQSPTGYWAGPGRIEYRYQPTYELAKEAWKKRNAPAWSGLRQEVSRLEKTLVAVNDPRSFNPRGVLEDNAAPFIGVSLGAYGVFAVCHLLGLILLWAQRAASRRRWRLAL